MATSEELGSYDLAFPVFCAGLADLGQHGGIPDGMRAGRALVIRANRDSRAIENVAYVVCANRSGAYISAAG
jgi:hypothetical protein